jgi:hypothetical protein
MLLAVPDARATLSLAFEEAGVVLDMVVAPIMATGSEAAALRLVTALAGSLDESDPVASSTGHKAKAALILRVASDPRLMELTRREAGQQPEPLAGISWPPQRFAALVSLGNGFLAVGRSPWATMGL